MTDMNARLYSTPPRWMYLTLIATVALGLGFVAWLAMNPQFQAMPEAGKGAALIAIVSVGGMVMMFVMIKLTLMERGHAALKLLFMLGAVIFVIVAISAANAALSDYVQMGW